MLRTNLIFTLLALLVLGAATAAACEYKAGETEYLDYAYCRYGEDSIQVVSLPEDANWETCVYYMQAFRPGKLLAVIKHSEGREILSINDRSQIGNPCYLTKRACDAALRMSSQ